MPFRKLQAQPALCTAVQVFNDPQASKNAVAAAGEAFLCVVYGGKIDDNLDVKRHQLYLRTIAKQKVCAKFDLATLPPTSAAARQHSFRVYHQVQQWRGVALNPTDWGWRLKDGRLTPLPTLREPAPETLLHLITCNCRSGCERNCDVGEAAFHAHRCVDSVRDMAAATTIRAVTQVTEKTIRVGLMKTNWTQHQCRKDDDPSG